VSGVLEYDPPVERKGQRSVDLENRKNVLTHGVARQVMIASFLFSQGSDALQKNLLHYLHTIRPSWRVTPALRENLNQQLRPLQTLIQQGIHKNIFLAGVDTDYVKSNVEDDVEGMQAIFNGEQAFEEDTLPLLGTIMAQMLERDYTYLVEFGNRPKAETFALHHLWQDTPSYSPLKDAYLSHFCYFGILRKDTGIPEFNELFADIGNHVQDRSTLFEHTLSHQSHKILTPEYEYTPYAALLEDVVRAYNRRHHDQICFPHQAHQPEQDHRSGPGEEK
jgi:hypothetical protein